LLFECRNQEIERIEFRKSLTEICITLRRRFKYIAEIRTEHGKGISECLKHLAKTNIATRHWLLQENPVQQEQQEQQERQEQEE
jgi:hypothetical protein